MRIRRLKDKGDGHCVKEGDGAEGVRVGMNSFELDREGGFE